MTELEWLQQQSGLSADELKAMEAVAGHAKFVGMLQKIIASNQEALTAKDAAEKQRLDFEKRYNEEFIPEMRKVTQDSLRAQGELAAAQARLKAAQEYGIVPEPPAAPTTPAEPPRAPGSPAPQFDAQEWSRRQSNAITTLNDLNAEHFKLYGTPLPNSQELVDKVERERTLGNKTYSLKQAWETVHNVAQKREEIAAAAKQKEKDEWTKEVLRTEREKNGSNPNVRTGQPSRFSSYKPSDAAGKNEPWKASHSKQTANRDWRKNAESKIREAMAS